MKVITWKLVTPWKLGYNMEGFHQTFHACNLACMVNMKLQTSKLQEKTFADPEEKFPTFGNFCIEYSMSIWVQNCCNIHLHFQKLLLSAWYQLYSYL